MKYITLAILSLFCLGIKAQTTNAHGQYMVKTATWKSYGGQSSFKMDLGYYLNGNLKEVTKNYELNGKKYRDTYSISYNSKGERMLKFIRHVNGKQDFSAKALYNFNENNLISNINWYAPSKNRLVQTFQMSYNENRELVKLIKTTSENITAGDGCYDENISDGTKKDILNGGLENSIESGEDRVVSNSDGEKDNYAANSENGIEKEKAGDNTGTVEQRFNEGGTDKVIRCPSLYDVLIDMGRTAKYSEIIEYIKKVKRSEGEEQKKLHCLDVLTKMCKTAAKKEVEYIVSHLPENINFDRYKRTKEKLMTYMEIDVSPYIKIVDTKRDKVEFDELNKLVEGVDRDNRNELLDVMEKIKNGEYEKRNSDRFVEGLRKRVYAMDEVSKETARTNESAQEIRNVTEIIAGISNQTNLLALNASIEAARAGENGRGFAVVAEQIRELADQSRESTEHINQIVNDLIENSNISVETAKKVSEAFEKQDAKIKDTEAIFGTLNSEINRVGGAVGGIAGEVDDLEEHKNNIAAGVDNLAEFAEQNAESGRITSENMRNLENVMVSCKSSTDRIVNVSNELVSEIKNLSQKKLGKIDVMK